MVILDDWMIWGTLQFRETFIKAMDYLTEKNNAIIETCEEGYDLMGYVEALSYKNWSCVSWLDDWMEKQPLKCNVF